MREKFLNTVLGTVIAVVLGALIAALVGAHHLNQHPIQFVPSSSPDVIMRVLDPTLEDGVQLWQAEIGRRFHNAVGIVVHGGDFVQGEWIVEGNYASGNHVRSVTDVVREAQALFPDRTIVLVSCNPGHIKLGIAGVYYAMSSVWVVPDRDVTPDVGHERLMATIGNEDCLGNDESGSPSTGAPEPSRWQQFPDDAGNIFEFVSDQ